MQSFHWFEAKQLDRVTNFSTETEVIKAGNTNNIPIFYYCTYHKEKKDFWLSKNIIYLGYSSNRYIKAIEFHIYTILKMLQIVLTQKRALIMVNPDLVFHSIIPFYISKFFNTNPKFIIDVRTTPVDPKTFERDMKNFHKKFKFAVKNFDGLSFITPFMEKYILSKYNFHVKTVNWSSGVDIELFDPEKVLKSQNTELNVKTFFYHGGISISRGNLDLIKACNRLINEGYKLRLIQIGIIVDKEIRNFVNSLANNDWCILRGAVPLELIPNEIASIDVPVLPFPNYDSWRVSSPIKLMEYLAMNKCVIAPKMEAFTDVFGKDSSLVLYYDASISSNEENIYSTLKKILIENLQLINSDDAPRNFVKQNYTWKIQANNLFNFCSNLWEK
jgi:glycosyltransferase involved in cell wall biosynthesis